MSDKENQKKALIKASQTKREQTYARAEAALASMEADKVPINFESVAKVAGVSKAWLYKQPELCELIKSKRDKSSVVKRNADIRSLLKSRENEISQLKEKLKKKDETIKKLKTQLEKVYGDLYKQNKNSW